MDKLTVPITPKNRYPVPEWVKKAPKGVFPYGAREFYCYLLIFGPSGCWQYNCRLAQRFDVKKRTIQRWIDWLKAHKLIHIKQPYNRRRRIYAYPYDSPLEWFASHIFARRPKGEKSHILTQAEFKDRRDHQLHLLFPEGIPPILPFDDMPPPTDGA